MQTDRTAFFPPLAVRGSVLVTDGYGVRVSVHRRRLMIRDGIGRQRREVALARPTCGLKRLIILGHEGYVTLEAIRWLTDVGAALMHIDRDGRVLMTTATLGLDDARLRRAQGAASTSLLGVEVSRSILRGKLQGHASVLSRIDHTEEQRAAIAHRLKALDRAETLDELRVTEAQAAAAYWSSWERVPVPFARADAGRVPDHWQTFGRRSSPLTNQPRLAANPPNAMLNYLYALLEAEARIGCLAMGLDPGLGIVHTDQRARDSLALDVMEAVRPQVDGYVLDLLQGHTFRAKDFHETRQGVCRIFAPLTHLLAETAPAWARALAPVIERVALSLGRSARAKDQVPTRLTQSRRSASKDYVRARPPRLVPLAPKPLPPACRTCGLILEDPARTHCDDCLPERRAEHAATFVVAGPARLARMRAEGKDPLQRPETKAKLREARLRRVEEAKPSGQSPVSSRQLEEFRRDILPGLRSVPVRRLAAVTGLSRPYCSEIRRGLRVPHPRHWEAFRRAGD